MNIFRVILTGISLSVSVQNTSFGQSSDGDIKAHLMIALVSTTFDCLDFNLDLSMILLFDKK